MKKRLFTNYRNLLGKPQVIKNTLLFLLLWIAVLVYPQAADNSYPQMIPSSPTVASIEKFGDYPIGYNTGTVGISAELYSFPLSKGINLDIRLDYHSSGIKVESVSDRVGTGWTLFASGCISRKIMGGKRDEESGMGFYNLIKNRKGYTYPKDGSVAINANTADSIAKGWLDSSPDIFTLSLLGRNYKLFLGNDGEIHTIPYANLKINKHPLSSPAGGTWEITDESGIHYIFGVIEQITPGSGSSITYASNWWLTSIVSPEGNTLASFEYKASNPVYPNITRHTIAFETFIDPNNYHPIVLYYTGDWRAKYLKEKNYSNPDQYTSWDLDKITIPGKGYLTFENGTSRPDQVWKLISEIRYYDEKNVLTNKYSFSYTNQSNRPFLTQILKTGSDGTSVKYRSFTYYPNLPNTNSKSQDLWGYYNGANNTSLYPYETMMATHSYTSADRNPTDKAVAGTLKEIIYPTGGKTLFEFENNKVFGTDNVYTTQSTNFSHRQDDFGEASSAIFSTASQKVNMSIEMSVHPAGLYSTEISLVNVDNTSNVLHYTNASVPGNGFVNMGTNSNGTQRFVLTLSQYNLPAGNYQWVTKITNNDLRPNSPKPSPIIISNNYYKIVAGTATQEKLVGGLRIAQISNYDSDGILKEKVKYTYLDKNGKCSGIGAPAPLFLRKYVVTEIIYLRNVTSLEAQYIDMQLIEIGETDLNWYCGSAVQYTYVTEERMNEGSVSLKTDYEYQKRNFNHTIIPHPDPDSYYINPVPYSLNDYEEGLLICKTDYKSNAPVRKETNTYTIKDIGSDIYTFTSISLNKYFLSPEISPAVASGSTNIKYQMGTYDFKAAKVYLSSKKTEEIMSNGTITNTSNFYYDNLTYFQPTKTNQTNSNGLTKEISYKYCYDASSAVNDSMKIRNIINQPLFTTTKVNNAQTEQSEVQFDFFNSNKIVEPKLARKQTAASSPYSTTTYSNYDKYGNPVYLSVNDADKIVYLWSYNGLYPIAEIKNAAFADVESTVKTVFSVASIDALSALAAPNETKLKDGSLQKALPNALVTTYTYKPSVGILTVTDPNCTVTNYDYDSWGRLKETYLMDGSTKRTLQSYTYHYQNQ